MRPKSAAPYPHEDQPMPLNSRPKSTAPYPEGDMRGPHLNPATRHPVGAGPHADRPGSAFGIRPLSPGSGLPPGPGRGRPVSSQSSMGGWDSQLPASYRKPSPGPAGQWQQPPPPQHDPRYGAGGPGIVPAGMPVGDPTRTRLQKPNPNLQPAPQGPPPGQHRMGGGYPGGPGGPGGQPGRDYGRPGANNRPVSDSYGPAGGGGAHPQAAAGRVPVPAGSNPNLRPQHSAAVGPGSRPVSHVAPQTGQNVRPGPSPAGATSSPGPAAAGQRPPPTGSGAGGAGGKPAAGNISHPDGKTMGQGPATFEEMGIPQGKTEGDCVSFIFSLPTYWLLDWT